MNKQFTSGPWKVESLEQIVGPGRFEIQFGDDGECIAEIVHSKANANLIALAPNLLDVLQKVEDSEEFDLLQPSLKQLVETVLSKVYGDK